MSWQSSNPGAGFGSHMGNPGGGVGGTSSGGSSGPNSGGGYQFRRTKSGVGNWNTGGVFSGTGSMAQGLRGLPRAPSGPMTATPTSAPVMQAPAQPPAPSYPQPGTVTDVFGPTVRMDPGILGQMLNGLNKTDFSSTFPARPGATTRMGFSKDQSRLPGMGGNQNGSGRVGGGQGGGGGGGW